MPHSPYRPRARSRMRQPATAFRHRHNRATKTVSALASVRYSQAQAIQKYEAWVHNPERPARYVRAGGVHTACLVRRLNFCPDRGERANLAQNDGADTPGSDDDRRSPMTLPSQGAAARRRRGDAPAVDGDRRPLRLHRPAVGRTLAGHRPGAIHPSTGSSSISRDEQSSSSPASLPPRTEAGL